MPILLFNNTANTTFFYYSFIFAQIFCSIHLALLWLYEVLKLWFKAFTLYICYYIVFIPFLKFWAMTGTRIPIMINKVSILYLRNIILYISLNISWRKLVLSCKYYLSLNQNVSNQMCFLSSLPFTCNTHLYHPTAFLSGTICSWFEFPDK